MRGTFTSVGHEFEASRSAAGFEYPGIELRTLLAKDMSLNVCVPQDPVRIDFLKHPDEIFEPRVHSFQFLGL